jgi:hypothetical protein
VTGTAQYTNTNNNIFIIIFIIVIIIIRHSILVLIFLHIRSSPFSVSPHSSVHIFLTSPVLSFCGWQAGGFPAAIGVWGNRNVVRIVADMIFFDLEKSGTIGGTPGQCSLKPIKQGMSQENRDEHDL